MSQPENTASAAAPKKKGSMKLIIIVVGVLLVVGGAGGFFYWRSATAAAATKPDAKNGKSSSSKSKKAQASDDEESNEESNSADSKSEKSGEKSGDKAQNNSHSAKESLAAAIPDDGDVKHIIELQPFIVNLADTDSARYLRLTVNLGVGGESGASESGGKPDQLFMNRIRNAMLAVLTTKSSADVLNIEGKTKLRRELLKAAQAASEEPKVEAIYITDFIVQL